MVVIVSMLMEKKQWADLFIDAFFNQNGLWCFMLMVVAMLANISVEAIKWKILVRSNTTFHFSTSLMAVFSGVTAGLITPHGIGDYIGRILFLSPEKRLDNIGSVLFSRVAQLCITCLTGVFATAYFYFYVEADSNIILALVTAVLTLLFIFISWKYRAYLLDRMKRIPFIKRIESWFEQLRLYSNKLFAITLALSALRYIIFTAQFVCLLLFFDVHVPIEILVIGAVFTFFVKSIIPTFIDLGVRELAAVFFFSSYDSISEQHVLAASLSLWFFNLVLPAVIGLFCMFKLEYQKQK